MNCYVHDRVPAVGMCAVCQRAVCRECVVPDAPRIVCATCARSRQVFGFEYRSRAQVGSWPLVHICTGVDPVTMRPKVARGVIAIGNIAVGVLALAGVSFGLFSLGGLSIGLLVAVGGAAVGVGLSLGGFALGSVAVGGAAIALNYAMGGLAIAPAVIDGGHCADAAREFFARYIDITTVAPSCR